MATATCCANIQRRITRDKISMRKSVLLLLAIALLPACGLKGPLYLPAQKPTASPPAAAVPASGTQPDDKTKPAPESQ
jgi:predicted small lipoprotein YifL